MKKPFLILTILIVTIVILFGAKTFVSNRISTSGVELGSTQDDLSQYKNENMILKQKIYALSSLSYIAVQAEKKGFIEGKTTIAVKGSLPIALKQ